jgi:hypothetical protein
MAAFRDTLSYCNLFDLGFSGPPWTFDNKQKDRRNVKARIDRAVASDCWTQLFPDAKVTHICSTRSDHLPLLIEYEKNNQNVKPREMRYETMWERDPGLSVAIEEAWEGGPPCQNLNDLVKKLNTTRSHMHNWSRENFGNITRTATRLRNKIKSLWKKPRSAWREAAIQSTTAELDETLHREEMMWRQRSRVNWLHEGDRNTKYFHKKATWRQSKNRIKKLKGLNGTWTDDPAEIDSMATDFFKSLYSEDKHMKANELIDLLHRPVSEEMNHELCKEFSDEEISDALFQIGPIKAPGPDGLPARFFQRNWAVLKKEVTTAVRNFFSTGLMAEGINDTVIVLIPKGVDSESLADYRPISLCNVAYKII